jgi:hypothetical protein
VKRVTVTLELSEHFIKMLQVTCQMSRLIGSEQKDRLTALGVLGAVVLGEARGAFPEQIHAMTPIEWRDHIEPMSDKRSVREVQS